jgi:hypothetical protein
MTQLYVIRRNTQVLHTTDNLRLAKLKFQLYTQCNKHHVISLREYSPIGLGKCLARHTGRDKPEQGKIYSLTGAKGEACIAAGNTWAESEVEPERPKIISPLGG